MSGNPWKLLALGALLCGMGQTVDAQPAQQKLPPAAAEAGAPAPQNALRLVHLLVPDEQLLSLARRSFEAGFDNAMNNKPQDASVYSSNPGLREAIIAATWPVVREHFVANLPVKAAKMAGFFAQRLSPDDIDQLVGFYGSPTGTKLIAKMYASLDARKLAQAAHANGTGAARADAVKDVSDSAAEQALSSLDADDYKQLFTFAATPAFQRLKAALPEFHQLTAQLASEDHSAVNADVKAAAAAAVKKYMANKKAAAKP